MPQFCPFCKARLWSDPWLSRGRLKCPRCGNEFRPTVSWTSFRLLVFLVVAIVLVLTVSLPPGTFFVVLLLAALGFVFWYLPKLVNLQPLPSDLTPNEGVLEPDLKEAEWEEKLEQLAEQSKYRYLMLFLLGLLLVLLFLGGLHYWSF